jgi:phospholipid/cholesterol/gamma-HCH transport system substrate-binding protein
MGGKKTEIIVGLVGLCAIVILIAGLIFLREYHFDRRNYALTVWFDNVSGLKEGDPVMVAGVREGSVKSIFLQSGVVQVKIDLYEAIQLSDDAKFSISSSGLAGMKFVDIRPGQSSRPLDTSQPIPGSHQTEVFEVIGMMGDLIAEVRQLVSTINKSVTDESLLVSLHGTITDTQDLIQAMRSFVEDNRADLTSAVQDFKTTSKELRGLVERNRSSVDSTVALFSDSAGRFRAILSRLEEISSTFKEIGDRIDQGEGTLGQLINSRELYDELHQTSKKINLLIEDIKKHPGKYLKFSVIDF